MRIRRAFLTLVLAAIAAMAADVTGKWSFTVQTDAGAGNPTFVLKQEGERLTGTYTGALGAADVTGTVKDNKIDFEFDGSYDGNRMRVKYIGTIEGPARMRGTLAIADSVSGTWKAEKQ